MHKILGASGMKSLVSFYSKVIRTLRKGEILPSELCRMCQKRISRLRELNVFTIEMENKVVAAAQESDKRAKAGIANIKCYYNLCFEILEKKQDHCHGGYLLPSMK